MNFEHLIKLLKRLVVIVATLVKRIMDYVLVKCFTILSGFFAGFWGRITYFRKGVCDSWRTMFALRADEMFAEFFFN